ncbi:DUF397 domain-containing protein [Streptomyces sp. SAS_260]|uniref:DUF397 domain-containing protein n=1 Tax=Streptomyces sp. SAS_260 TaxID=3412751 RepID=UPI00403C48A9
MNGSWSWRRSSFSDAAGNQCVEVAWTGRSILVRDSKAATGTPLAFSGKAWDHFIDAAGVATGPACE